MKNLEIDSTVLSQIENQVYQGSKKIEPTDRFYLESLRSVNYDTYSAINELIDNSIDAESTQIEIIYDKKKSILIIKDNGRGMSTDVLSNIMNLGCDRTYNQSQIGYFGMGLKSASLNLLNLDKEDEEFNNSVEILTCDGVETSKIIWEPNKSVKTFHVFKLNVETQEMGTSIILNGVVDFYDSVLKKNLGVVFYPTLKNNIVNIIVNGEKVIGTDPLYRSSDKTNTNYVTSTVLGEEIKITAVAIDSLEERIPWDGKINNKGDQTDGWSFAKYGCYIIYGGRYIEVGGTTLNTRLFDSWYSRTRLEFTIPKTLTESFKITFNKTSGIKINKELMPDLHNKIGDLFTWGRSKRSEELKLRKQLISSEEEKENEDIVKLMNKSALNAGIVPPKTTEEIKKKIKVSFEANPNKEPKEKTKDKEPKKARVVEKKIFDVKFDDLGSVSVFWKLTFENDLFTIYVNTSHPFYRRIYSNLNKEAKLGIVNLLGSMALTQYRTAELGANLNDEYFWDTYWGDVSLQLVRIMNN
jgi:hypothetical protein